MAEVPQRLLQWRQETGADQYDEIWEGVLHMPPVPNREHQDLEGSLEFWLRLHWAQPLGHKVYHQINVASPGGWPDKNYRVPDLVLLTPDRFGIDRNEYFDGGPDVVVELHSPNDESYEKLDFYAAVGVREVWIIDRDSRRPELFVCGEGRHAPRTADADGWIASAATGIELRHVAAAHKLALRMAGREGTRQELPD
ncbi:MAG: Uma2 family endonuclease [Pirellulales bacterium]